MPADAAAVVPILKRIPLFSSLPPEALNRLAVQLDTRRCPAGEAVVKVNEPGDSFFYILNGRVKVFRPSKSGGETVVGVMGAGEFFGEQALLDGRPRTASIYTVEPTALLVLRRDSFMQVLLSDPSVMLAIVWVLSDRIRHLHIQLDEAYHLTLEQRVARRLLELGKKHGQQDGNGVTLHPSLTLDVLAGMVGSSVGQVSEVLLKWQQRDITRISWENRITVLSEKELELEAAGSET